MSTAKPKYLNEFAHVVEASESLAKWALTYISKTTRDMLQNKTSITKPIKTLLETKYKNYWMKFSFLNKYENINYSGSVVIENKNLMRAYVELFLRLQQHTSFQQFNKYRKFEIKKIEKGIVYFEYIDSLWNKKERKESVLLFKKYILDEPTLKQWCKSYENDIENITNGSEIKFDYVITNNINDKLAVYKMNSKWNSCQARNEWVSPRNYARWLYDFFNNWCIAPLIIYQWWEIVWRSAFRIFFDEDGKRYINLERIFWHWHLINNLTDFCRVITENLIKLNETLTISEQFSVTNTYKINPWFDSLKQSSNFNLERVKYILRQPKRIKHESINYWYYQDSKIHTVCSNEDNKYMYDCISPSDDFALHIITLKDVSSKKA